MEICRPKEGSFYAKWEMKVNISMVMLDDVQENIIGEDCEGSLFMDDKYGYWERAYTICSDTYYSTFRFNKSRMGDVLKYIADNSPLGLEEYLQSLEDYEWIENEHSL